MNPQAIDLSIPQGAIFSEDGNYRYALWRIWSPPKPILMIVGLNPSKAGAIINDPTVTRGVIRADREGFGGFFMGNLYGLISTDPKELLGNGDFGWAIGELTDYYLREMIRLSSRHLVAWGSFKPVTYRRDAVLKMIKEPYCLGVNADGNPKHPLYVSYKAAMIKYEVENEH